MTNFLKLISLIALTFFAVSAVILSLLIFITSGLAQMMNIPAINFIDVKFVVQCLIFAMVISVSSYFYNVYRGFGGIRR